MFSWYPVQQVVMIVACLAAAYFSADLLWNDHYAGYLRFAFSIPTLRVFTLFKSMRRLSYTLFVSLSILFPLVVLVGLVFMAYAMVGVNFFAGQFSQLQDNAPDGNFNTVPLALLSLWQLF